MKPPQEAAAGRAQNQVPDASEVSEPGSVAAPEMIDPSDDTLAQPMAQATSTQKAGTAARPAISSINDLLAHAFHSKPDVLLRLASEKLEQLPLVNESLREQVAAVEALAKSDVTLNGPFKLLQYVASKAASSGGESSEPLEARLGRLQHLALLALGQHPVFKNRDIQLGDPDGAAGITVNEVLEEVQNARGETFGIPEEQFVDSDRDRLRRNAIACLSLVRVLQRAWTLDDYIDANAAALWLPSVPKDTRIERTAGSLSATKELGAFGLIVSVYQNRVRERDQEITRLNNLLEIETARIDEMTAEKLEAIEREKELITRVDLLSADLVGLRNELDKERDNRVVDRSHAIDDYETLRTRVIRRLSDEINLLTDALHAVRNDAPQVAAEFLDRSLVALSREVEDLKDATGGLK